MKIELIQKDDKWAVRRIHGFLGLFTDYWDYGYNGSWSIFSNWMEKDIACREYDRLINVYTKERQEREKRSKSKNVIVNSTEI